MKREVSPLVRLVAVGALVASVLFAGCGSSGSASSSGTSAVTIRIGGVGNASPLASGSAPGTHRLAGIPAGVANIRFTISGEGMETIVMNHAVAAGDNEAVVTLNVPKGRQRVFLVEAFDSQGNLLYYSEEPPHDLLTDSITLTILMISTNPTLGTDNWTVVYAPPGGTTAPPNILGMAFGGNNTFVAIDGDGGVVTSNDGTDWFTADLAPSEWISWITSTPNKLTDVAFGDGLFVAVGVQYENPNIFVSSDDGVTWIDVTGVDSLEAVAFGNGTFVAVGSDYNGYGKIWHSDNAADSAAWTEAPVPAPVGAVASGLRDVAYGNGTFVAVGWDNVYVSSDGVDWSAVGEPADGGTLDQVVFANGVFTGISYTQIYTSDDGITWTAGADLPGIDGSYYLTTGDGRVVIVSDYGDILLPSTTTVGPATTWTAVPYDTVPGVPANNGLRCGTAGTGYYVVGGDISIILRSDPL